MVCGQNHLQFQKNCGSINESKGPWRLRALPTTGPRDPIKRSGGGYVMNYVENGISSAVFQCSDTKRTFF